MKIKLLIAFFLLLGIPLCAQEQTTVSGKVFDEINNPIPGVNISVKGQKVYAVSDLTGAYSIKVNSGEVLVYSYIGLTSKEMNYTGQKVINVTLTSNEVLNEVVVRVGYGTVKLSDLTGAVSSIKGDDLLKGNPTSVVEGLQGKLAGVQVQQSEGSPGAGINIQIRGANSFTTSAEPLYVVDGIPFNTDSAPSSAANSGSLQNTNALSFINPQDIESIEVLKDASSTAIYGSRGANGVVLITTKKGQKGVPKIEFNSSYSVSDIINTIDVLNAEQYQNWRNEEVSNRYIYEGVTYTSLPYPTPEVVEGDKDWQKMIFQKGLSSQYNLSMSGADDNGYYMVSGNYLSQEGIIKSSGYDRYNARINVSRKIRPWIQLGMNSNYSNSITKFAKTSAGDFSIIRSALIFPPNRISTFDETSDGELLWLSANPHTYITSAKDEINADNMFLSSFAELKFTKWLKFRQNVGYTVNTSRRNTYYTRDTQEGSSYSNINGKAGLSDNWSKAVTLESLLQFDKTIGKNHSISAVLGTTNETRDMSRKAIVATNFPTDITGEYDISQGLNQQIPTSDRSQTKLISFLGRVNYTLMQKYLFTASYRRDGSSKFSDTNKWADFMSFAFAWKASGEKFIKDLNVFSNLKLRTSFGETGNQAIPSYRTILSLEPLNYPVGGTLTSGFAEPVYNGPVNPNLKWETTSQFNAGIDMGFLKNRINITVDLFYKKTRDLLQSVTIPLSTGFPTMNINYGNVTNRGLEITGDFHAIANNKFKWDINANISFIKNKVGGLAADQFASRLWYGADNVFIQRNGLPIGAIFGYVEDGFYDNEAEIRADKAYTNATDAVVKAKLGEVKYRDYNDDGVINQEDKRIIGDTNPKYTYGITNNLTFGNLTASFYFQGTYGNDIFNGNLLTYNMQGNENIPVSLYNSRWTPENTANAKWPRATNGYNRTMLVSDRYVEDGSYLRLKNINIGYTFRTPIKQVSSLNVYCSVTNVFTLTKYSWLDPDVNAFGGDPSRRGVDIFSYPSNRTFSIGAKIIL